MKHAIAIALVLAVVDLAACGKREPESKTMDYFMQHPGEIDQVQKECANKGISPMADTPEARTCMAAANAARARFFGHSASGANQ